MAKSDSSAEPLLSTPQANSLREVSRTFVGEAESCAQTLIDNVERCSKQLAGNDPDAVLAALQTLEADGRALQQMMDNFRESLSEFGYRDIGAAIAATGDVALQERWSALRASLAAVRDFNRGNIALARRLEGHGAQSLRILRGMGPTPAEYGPAGESTTSTTAHHYIGSA